MYFTPGLQREGLAVTGLQQLRCVTCLLSTTLQGTILVSRWSVLKPQGSFGRQLLVFPSLMSATFFFYLREASRLWMLSFLLPIFSFMAAEYSANPVGGQGIS